MSNNAIVLRVADSRAGAIPCADCPLRRLEIFEPVSAPELACIEHLKQRDEDHAAGALLIAENEADAPLLTLLEGWALRFKSLPGGRRQILNVLLPGDFIGLQQKMGEGAHHGVEALTDVRVCRFARDTVWTLHRELPSLGYDITWLAAHENSLVDDNLLSVGRRSALARVAALLLTLYARALPHDPDADAVGLFFPLTQQHIADAMGLSLVHTHRVMRELRQRRLYEMRAGSRLVLPDLPALARLAQLRWPLTMGRRPLI